MGGEINGWGRIFFGGEGKIFVGGLGVENGTKSGCGINQPSSRLTINNDFDCMTTTEAQRS